jgi:hypothetical protein
LGLEEEGKVEESLEDGADKGKEADEGETITVR